MLAGVVLLVIGALIGFYLARWQSTDDGAELAETNRELGEVQRALAQVEQRNWDYYRTVEGLAGEIESLRNGSGGSAPSGQGATTTTSHAPVMLGGTYGDGVHSVGEDILPGTYDGVVTADMGYWARLKGTDGAIGSIIANSIVRGPFMLTIVESDKAVELRGVEISPR